MMSTPTDLGAEYRDLAPGAEVVIHLASRTGYGGAFGKDGVRFVWDQLRARLKGKKLVPSTLDVWPIPRSCTSLGLGSKRELARDILSLPTVISAPRRYSLMDFPRWKLTSSFSIATDSGSASSLTP